MDAFSLYIAPLIVAAVQVVGFAVSAIGLAERRRGVLLLDPAKQRMPIEQPYDIAAMMMVFTIFIVGVFYCLDALHGERRDRSVLFWKSLPISDLTTVLSKIFVPLAILPWSVIGIFEKITFGTNYFGRFCQNRLTGFAPEAFDFQGREHPTIDSLAQLTPGKYLTSPGLWIGILIFAAFVAAAVQLRRRGGPI